MPEIKKKIGFLVPMQSERHISLLVANDVLISLAAISRDSDQKTAFEA